MKIAVCVSGGGTNLQAIIDKIESGEIHNTEIAVVISNNKNAYALERAAKAGIEGVCISPKDYASRDEFNKAFLEKLDSYNVDLVVLAGFLVVIPEEMIRQYRNRIINNFPGHFGTAKSTYNMLDNDPRVAIFSANNKSYLTFEDGSDCNFSDLIIEIYEILIKFK